MTEIDELSLADWRRRIAALYVDVRRRHPTDPDGALEQWRAERETLFREHPQSPVMADARASFRARHFPVDPELRFEVVAEPASPGADVAADVVPGRKGPDAAGAVATELAPPLGAAAPFSFAAPLFQLPVSGGGEMGFRRIGWVE